MDADAVFAAAVLASLQVAVANSVRGLLRMEVEGNPAVTGLAIVVSADGDIDLSLTSERGLPVGGYSL